ncbi:MAG TPA: hypothetical protein VKQ06_04995, partial [Gammaproteobacteria bacterium]|nr:hypothetical protein [Gammaproteobacteria bacterium]
MRLFILVVAAAPALCFAQSDDEIAARQRELVARIDEVQSAYGPQAQELIEPLTELALVFEENGDEIFARATTERVLQIVRTNFGLHSLEQVPLLTRIMADAEARGDHELAWQHEQTLFDIARRSPEDLRSVPIMRDIGDRRIDVLERYINGEFP